MTRSGGSLRMHNRMRGRRRDRFVAADARRRRHRPRRSDRAAKRMIRKPMTAFQKPITVQGSVSANSTSSDERRATPKPPGESASAASASEPDHGGDDQRTTNSAPPVRTVSWPARAACLTCGGERSDTRNTSSISGAAAGYSGRAGLEVQCGDVSGDRRANEQRRGALVCRRRGAPKSVTRRLAPPAPDEVRVRALLRRDQPRHRGAGACRAACR